MYYVKNKGNLKGTRLAPYNWKKCNFGFLQYTFIYVHRINKFTGIFSSVCGRQFVLATFVALVSITIIRRMTFITGTTKLSNN